jgi:hypothetical protein
MRRSIYTKELLLNLASREEVSWAFIKLSSIYKFVGMFV